MRSTGSNITTTAARTRTTRGEERVERTSIHPARVAGPDPSVLLLLLPLALRNRVLLVLAEEPQSGATYSSQRKDISSVEVLLKARDTQPLQRSWTMRGRQVSCAQEESLIYHPNSKQPKPRHSKLKTILPKKIVAHLDPHPLGPFFLTGHWSPRSTRTWCQRLGVSLASVEHRRSQRMEHRWVNIGMDTLQEQSASLLETKGIATRSKGLTTRNKKLVETISK